MDLFPWKRYGLIVELAKKAEQHHCPQFGKTMLQKMIYLLKDLYDIDCGYSFGLYTYGLFSAQILQDLDLVETLKGVVVSNVSSRTGGYQISPGPEQKMFLDRAKEYLKAQPVKEAMVHLMKDFSDCSAKTLELSSTIVYVYKEMKTEGKPNRPAIVRLVHDIKPHFSESDIDEAIKQLEQKGHLNFSK